MSGGSVDRKKDLFPKILLSANTYWYRRKKMEEQLTSLFWALSNFSVSRSRFFYHFALAWF